MLKKSKKVFVLLISSGTGGAEKRFANLFKYLSENPDPNLVIEFYVNKSLASQLPSIYNAKNDIGLKFIFFGFPFIDNLKFKSHQLLKRIEQFVLFFLLIKCFTKKYDTAHFINLSALKFNFLVRARKKIWSCFDSENPEAYLPHQNLELKKLYKKLNHIDCLDENIANKVRVACVNFNITVTSTPCSFIDYSGTKIETKEMLITFSGYFREYKGVTLFISALKKCLISCPQLKAQFLGKGDLETFIHEELKIYIKNGRVKVGYANDPIQKMKKSLMFVSLQQKENYPSQSLLEAMACGNAIIATNVGLTKLLVNNRTGILIENSEMQLVEAIEYLYNNKENAILMGENARRLVLENHTVDKFWKYLQNLYLN
jgi:GalNAc-alpha-(1->4)-GalNAc-alpha-(1->3)-diNAcBac-PP-undecaprenol alpha-1,4-N-acetyl-D-galactosaminyltransferase